MLRKLTILVGLLSSSAMGQSPPPPPPALPTQGMVMQAKPGPPSKELDGIAEQSLATNTGLALGRVRSHVALSRRLASLTAKIDPDDPGFAGAYLESEPSTQLTILYVGNENAVRQRLDIPADLASSVKFVAAGLPLQALRGQQQRFLRSRGLQGQRAATYIDQRNNRIVVQLENGPEFERQRKAGAIDLPEKARVEIGPLPKDLAGTQPTLGYNPQAGDYIEGGRIFHQWNLVNGSLTAKPECTFAFGAKWGTLYGVLTAGHCLPGNYGTGYFYSVNNHWVELWGPDYESNNQTTKYDLQFHRTPGMTVYNSVYIQRKDGTSDYLYVSGAQGRVYQYVGYPTCKYGQTTKYECFNVTDNNYYFRNEAGYSTGPWVYVQASKLVADQGDSGGPVMDFPSGGYVNARGIISRGGYNTGIGAYQLIYMPIDHIDDVYPITVLQSNTLVGYGG